MKQIGLIESKMKYAADIWEFCREILDCDPENDNQFEDVYILM